MSDLAALRYELTHLDTSSMILTICVVASYFVGNISPAILLGKLNGIDIRAKGSGNAGTTNVLRTLGKKAAVLTLLIDILKGFIVVRLAYGFEGGAFALFCGFAVLCGHIWPMLYELKGGKGVATAIGVILAFDFRMGLMVAGIAVLLILITQRVSVGALLGAAVYPVLMQIYHPTYTFFALLTALIIWGKHYQNIKRILRGEEPKISFSAKNKEQQEE